MKYEYDVLVIGGGPAGMMAAGRAGEHGARVLLLEKNARLGIKLLATGKGRCNFTNQLEDKEMADSFGPGGKFLRSSLNRFGAQETVDFFERRGVVSKVEADGRVFPKSDKAQDILAALEEYMKEAGVEVRLGSIVKEVLIKNKQVAGLKLETGEVVTAKSYILATGGKSYPATGSTGDAYAWLEKLGHSVIAPRPALVPIRVKEGFVKELEGASLKNAGITVMAGKKKIASAIGNAIFTSDGLSGPAILDLSAKIGERSDQLALIIDLFPGLTQEELDMELRLAFESGGSKLVKNAVARFLPPKLLPVFLAEVRLESDRQVATVSREERKQLLGLLKGLTFNIDGLKGFEIAMVTAGGVALPEVDPKTMRSKLISNLYFAGEVLNLDGPTGGFNLQVCWSTGYAAGDGVSKNIS